MTLEPRVLEGWGRTAPSRADVVAPSDQDEVAAILAGAAGRGVLARGLGRSYGDAAQNAGGVVLDMTAMKRILSIDEGEATVRAEAGVSIGELVDALLPRGLFPPVTPGTREVTLGGAIAADVHGKNHHRDGSFCEHVASLVLQTPAGERLRVDRATTPDVFAATAAGMGLTGVVLEATFRALRVESAWVATEVERVEGLAPLLERLGESDAAHRYSVAWIDCLARGRSRGRAVLLRGDHAPLARLPGSARDNPLRRRRRARVRAPRWAPTGLLRRETVSAFNELHYRRAPRHAERLVSVDSFFYPLDAVVGWNRLYGSRGLLQYQFVVPFGREDALEAVLDRLAAAPAPSLLAVFKRLGAAPPLLAFPLPGWTLAVDLPAGVPPLAPVLDSLDEIVADAGGRVYLAKDSRLRPDLVERMYPGLPRWREIRARLDPAGVMRSDLARRLALAP